MLCADLMKNTVMPALKQRPKRLNPVGVSLAANVFADRMINRFVPEIRESLIGRMIVREQIRAVQRYTRESPRCCGRRLGLWR